MWGENRFSDFNVEVGRCYEVGELKVSFVYSDYFLLLEVLTTITQLNSPSSATHKNISMRHIQKMVLHISNSKNITNDLDF